MTNRKAAAYQIIQAANDSGVTLKEAKFNCFTGLSGGNIKILWPKLTDQECHDLSEIFPVLSQEIRENFPKPDSKEIVFNVSTKSLARSTELKVDLNNGLQHAITIQHGANTQHVAKALRSLADMISNS